MVWWRIFRNHVNSRFMPVFAKPSKQHNWSERKAPAKQDWYYLHETGCNCDSCWVFFPLHSTDAFLFWSYQLALLIWSASEFVRRRELGSLSQWHQIVTCELQINCSSITLLQVGIPMTESTRIAVLGWGLFVSYPVGTHNSLQTPPHTRQLARLLLNSAAKSRLWNQKARNRTIFWCLALIRKLVSR